MINSSMLTDRDQVPFTTEAGWMVGHLFFLDGYKQVLDGWHTHLLVLSALTKVIVHHGISTLM